MADDDDEFPPIPRRRGRRRREETPVDENDVGQTEDATGDQDTEASGLKVRNTGRHMLADPATGQKFVPGQVVEVKKRTGWLQSQIDAGIFEEV